VLTYLTKNIIQRLIVAVTCTFQTVVTTHVPTKKHQSIAAQSQTMWAVIRPV